MWTGSGARAAWMTGPCVPGGLLQGRQRFGAAHPLRTARHYDRAAIVRDGPFPPSRPARPATSGASPKNRKDGPTGGEAHQEPRRDRCRRHIKQKDPGDIGPGPRPIQQPGRMARERWRAPRRTPLPARKPGVPGLLHRKKSTTADCKRGEAGRAAHPPHPRKILPAAFKSAHSGNLLAARFLGPTP